MSARFKERMSIAEGLKTSIERHSTQEALEYYDRDPEGVEILWDTWGYTERKSGYKTGMGLRGCELEIWWEHGRVRGVPLTLESTSPIIVAALAVDATKLAIMKSSIRLSRKYNA